MFERRRLVAGFAAALFCAAAGASSAPVGDDVGAVAMAFSDAYVAGDWTTVESYLADETLDVYGSDLAEFARTRSSFRAMFDNDQKLWRGGARLGKATEISSTRSRNLATYFFHREFVLGDRRMTVRFCTVWRRVNGRWKLVQSANAVPTVHESAAEILARPSP